MFAGRAAGKIDAGKFQQEIVGRFLADFRQGGIESQQLSALRESVFFGSVGEKAEVADTHEAIGEHVKQEAADELFGIEGHRFQPVFVSLRAKSGLDPIRHSTIPPFQEPQPAGLYVSSV